MSKLNRADRSFVWVFYIIVVIGLIGGAMAVTGLIALLGVTLEHLWAGHPLVEIKESCLYLIDGTLACW